MTIELFLPLNHEMPFVSLARHQACKTTKWPFVSIRSAIPYLEVHLLCILYFCTMKKGWEVNYVSKSGKKKAMYKYILPNGWFKNRAYTRQPYIERTLSKSKNMNPKLTIGWFEPSILLVACQWTMYRGYILLSTIRSQIRRYKSH